MKKLTMIALAASAFMAFSCSSDDDNGSNNNNGGNVALSGKWKLTALTADEAVDGNGDGVSSTNLIAEGGSCFSNSYLQFSGASNVTNFLSMPSSMEENACMTATATGGYEADGNEVTVTITYDGETDIVDYTKNNNKLTTFIPDFYEVEVTVGGETTTTTVGATLVFTKE